MADLKTAIGTDAVLNAGIQALVSARFYRAGMVPQSVASGKLQLPDRPFVSYDRITEPVHYDQLGQEAREALYQFNIVADTNSEAETVAAAIVAWLDRFRGLMGPTGNQTQILNATLDDTRDGLTPPTDASERGPQVVQQDWRIFYRP